MAKGMRGRRRLASRQCRPTPYPLPSCDHDASECLHPDKCSKVFDKKDWEDANCSVCMEYPHNAVLLLCSSHEKGCRPYMCGTSFRYSNCLDQYKKAYTKVMSPHQVQPLQVSVDSSNGGSDSSAPGEKSETTELACPLCRGQVKGWTVVEPAREYLNAKKRSCTQDNCSFVGTFKELRKHVRMDHPFARPREVDPDLEQKWRRLERDRERDDVISTIRSSMPGAMVFGDYVIEGGGGHNGFVSDEEEGFDVDFARSAGGFEGGIDSNLVNVFLLLHALGPAGSGGSNRVMRRHVRNSLRSVDGRAVGSHRISPLGAFGSSDQVTESDDDDDDDGGGGGDDRAMSLVGRLRRQGRALLGRSGRRRRLREASGSQREI